MAARLPLHAFRTLALLVAVMSCGIGRSVTYDLAAGSLDVTIRGGPGDQIPGDGRSATVVFGDVDGDGWRDLVVGGAGAPGGLDPQPGCGRVHVLCGPFASGELRDLSATPAHVTIIGAERMRLGTGLAVGDFDGDGHDDIATGAPSFGPSSLPTGTRGSVMVFFGPLARGTAIDLAADTPGWRLDATDLDAMGSPLAAGDFNGDGIGDLAIGVPQADGPGNARQSAGEAHVFFGPLVRGTRQTLDAFPGGVIVVGRSTGPLSRDNPGELGHAFAVGDVSGDGIDDLAIAAWIGNAEGGVRVDSGEVNILLSPLVPRVLDLETAPADVTAWGKARTSITNEGDLLGSSLAIGDLDGDGVGDLVLGGPGGTGATGAIDRAGVVLVTRGPLRSGQVIDSADPSTYQTRIHGAAVIDVLGDQSALAVGDADGSGMAGLLLGRHLRNGPDGSRDRAGEVTYLCAPIASGEIDFAASEPEPRIFGRGSRDLLGRGLGVADLNGDGLGDLVMGASGAQALTGAGELQIFFGDPCDVRPSCDAGGPYLASCPGASHCGGGLEVPLDGTRSRSLNGGITSHEWLIECGSGTWTATGATTTACVDPSCAADCVVTLTVTDAVGRTSTCGTVLRLEDREPPVVVESREALACLWSPRHGAVRIQAADLDPAVSDACNEPVTWRLGPCASDQADDANGTGDGHFPDDCHVEADGSAVDLRAERDGTGRSGRTYTLTAMATDLCGNSSAPVAIGTVRVEHDRRAHLTCLRSAPRLPGTGAPRGSRR